MSKEAEENREDDYRMISEIQHFAFCRRQWALIHLEQQWEDNLLTVEGEIMHKRVHDESQSEMRKDKLIVRGMRIVSHKLGCSGICDAVEFIQAENGITLHGRNGTWQVRPVEYKHGKPKIGLEDELQLCAQAMCLEEMLSCQINEGDLFYGQPHRRTAVCFTDDLRGNVTDMMAEMNTYYHRGYTPKVKKTKACNSCSLKNLCIPELEHKRSVKDYIQKHMEES